MRQNRIGRPKLLLNRVERLLRLALARDDAECPICNLLAPGEPFVRPREKNRACQTAFYNAVDMPAEHFGLLLLRMAGWFPAEFTQGEPVPPGRIYEPQRVTL